MIGTPQCAECSGRGWHIGECHPRETCGVCCGSGLKMKAGDVVFTNLLGAVKLVRETNGQSGVDGWEVERSDGSTAYMFYTDFQLSELEVDEIRTAWRARHRRNLRTEAPQADQQGKRGE